MERRGGTRNPTIWRPYERERRDGWNSIAGRKNWGIINEMLGLATIFP